MSRRPFWAYSPNQGRFQRSQSLYTFPNPDSFIAEGCLLLDSAAASFSRSTCGSVGDYLSSFEDPNSCLAFNNSSDIQQLNASFNQLSVHQVDSSSDTSPFQISEPATYSHPFATFSPPPFLHHHQFHFFSEPSHQSYPSFQFPSQYFHPNISFIPSNQISTANYTRKLTANGPSHNRNLSHGYPNLNDSSMLNIPTVLVPQTETNPLPIPPSPSPRTYPIPKAETENAPKLTKNLDMPSHNQESKTSIGAQDSNCSTTQSGCFGSSSLIPEQGQPPNIGIEGSSSTGLPHSNVGNPGPTEGIATPSSRRSYSLRKLAVLFLMSMSCILLIFTGNWI